MRGRQAPAQASQRGAARRAWSLRARITLWTAGGSVAIFLASAAFVGWLIRDSVAREMESLSIEELAELSYVCGSEAISSERFSAAIETLDRDHPAVEIACRAWIDDGRTLFAQGGTFPVSVPSVASAEVHSWPLRGDPHLRHATATIVAEIADGIEAPRPEEMRLELFVDGHLRFAALRRTASFFMLGALIVTLSTTVGGALFALGVSRALGRIATAARASDLDQFLVDSRATDAPVEIERVITAIHQSLLRTRSEHARNLLLTAGLAHELRSPLQNMISEGEVTLFRPREGDEYRRALGDQLRELKQLALVVDNLVTLTALRNPKHLPRNESFDLGHEVELRLERECETARRRDVHVDIEQAGNTSIEGDREALVLMTRNLVANAVRWAAAGSTVSVTLDGTEESLSIVVDDAGPGVPVESRERIFEAFHQEAAAPSGERSGYGLGLALARAAALAHGGEIQVGESGRGGARFCVRLPRRMKGGIVAQAEPSSSGTAWI